MAIFSLAAQNRHRLLPDDYRVIPLTWISHHREKYAWLQTAR